MHASPRPIIPTHAPAKLAIHRLPADAGPTAEVLLEATACSSAWQQQQQLQRDMLQPLIMRATTSALPFADAASTPPSLDVWPNAAAVIAATACSRVWQQEANELKPIAKLETLAAHTFQDSIMQSIRWLQWQQNQPSQQQQQHREQPYLPLSHIGDLSATAEHLPNAVHDMQQQAALATPASCHMESATSSDQLPRTFMRPTSTAKICMDTGIHSCLQQIDVAVSLAVPKDVGKKLACSLSEVAFDAAVHDASANCAALLTGSNELQAGCLRLTRVASVH
jgi:hypothetical protein